MPETWKLVPTEPTAEMLDVAIKRGAAGEYNEGIWAAMLAAAPEPPHVSMTREEAQIFQNWRGMDGACAFHLIERHANGWADVARMMEAWLAANRETPNARANGLP